MNGVNYIDIVADPSSFLASMLIVIILVRI
jgi:hypothetical protein